ETSKKGISRELGMGVQDDSAPLPFHYSISASRVKLVRCLRERRCEKHTLGDQLFPVNYTMLIVEDVPAHAVATPSGDGIPRAASSENSTDDKLQVASQVNGRS